MTLWISLKVWIDWYGFHEVAWKFIFVEKIRPGPLQDLMEKWKWEKHNFKLGIVVSTTRNYIRTMNYSRLNSKNCISLTFIFPSNPEGGPGETFSTKINFHATSWNQYQLTQIFKLIHNVTLGLNQNHYIPNKKLSHSGEKVENPVPNTRMVRVLCVDQCFSPYILISLYSSLKVISNETKINARSNKMRCLMSRIPVTNRYKHRHMVELYLRLNDDRWKFFLISLYCFIALKRY